MKLGLFGPMKGLDTAQSSINELPGGGVEASIEHETMRGVTPEMLCWWFENIDGFTTWNGSDFSGREVPVYRYWHPFDHISVRWLRKVRDDQGRPGPGSAIYIEENLGGRYPVRQKVYVSRFDSQAFNFDIRLAGIVRVGHLDHYYEAVDGGSSYTTSLVVQCAVPVIGPLITRYARRRFLRNEVLEAWILHNVEESGETEKFVPVLFKNATSG